MNFDFITYQIILPALQKIAELTHSYGWAIILLTVAFRVLVSPLVAQTTLSMRRMSKLQPKMKAIQERYKGNPEQLQKKLVEFYAKNKVNPMGGCLPTLVQLPLLFALYAAFAGPPFTDKMIDIKVNVVPATKVQEVKRDEASGANSIYISKDGVAAKAVVFPGNSTIVTGSDMDFAVRAAEGKLPANFMPKWHMIAPKGEEKKNDASDANKEINAGPDTKPSVSQIDANGHATFTKEGEYHIQALIPGIAKEESFAFISGLGKVATGASLLKPENFDIVFLVLLFGLSMFISQKLTVPTPKPADGQELDEQQIIQQQTMKTMPLVTTGMFFFFPIPAGVYLYLVVSNIIQTFQTWLITRTPEPEFGDIDDEDVIVVTAPKNGGGTIAQPNKKAAIEKKATGSPAQQKKKNKRKK